MWKVELFLVLVALMSFASAAEKNAGKAKVTALKDQKDPKEKRDAPTGISYSYDVPQKAFHSPAAVHAQPPQPKHTHVEHYPQQQQQQQQHKVAPLEYVQQKQEAPQQQQHHEQYHPTSFIAPTQQIENLFHHQVKQLEDYSLNYPQYESYSQYPGSFGNYEKLIAFPVNQASNLKSMPYYQQSQSYQPYQQQSYQMASYAPAHYAQSFTQSPAAIYVPQTVSIGQKSHGKVPDYAQGSKGLSHYSTISSLQPISSSYTKQQSYDVPSYVFTPTERPFKPSPFMGASIIKSEPYRYEKFVDYTPSKNYLPAKEQFVAPVKEQYQSYAPPKEQYYTQQVPKEYYQQQSQLPKEYYQQYAQQYAPQSAPINYEVQYVQVPAGKPSYAPSNSYIQPQAPLNSYLPPSTPVHSYPSAASSYHQPSKVEAPKNSYLPPSAAPTKTYLPPVKIEKPKTNYLPPVNSYIPAPQPTQSNTYLPPNNPYSSHQQSSQEVYDSSEFHYGGHK